MGIGLKGRGYLMATSITSGQCRRRRSAGRPRPRQAQRQRPVPGPQIQRCATFALGAVDTKALAGPREMVQGEQESFIGGYSWQRSGLAVGSCVDTMEAARAPRPHGEGR